MATEWGWEQRGDTNLFEMLSLEASQSGLSWLTILRKREAYRRVFFQFDIGKVAAMTLPDDVDKILIQDKQEDRIVRHRGKIQAVINNAQCILRDMAEDNAFDQFLWSFVDDQPILNQWSGIREEAVTKSEESEAMSKALKAKGFKFVGPTTCYAFMQSVGMVIDHPVSSPEWEAAHERLKQRPGGYQQR